MRIERLFLARFGHFTDVDLTFPAPGGLHVVLGANEAGKSTALHALGDCLFGFPHRVDHHYLHPASELRVGVTLRTDDGRTGTFFRRRGRDNLTDADGRLLPESTIAAFLGGATRERFERVFGLNAAELRRGGEAILKGEGDAGEAILQAHTGLRGFRAAVKRLHEEAAALAGDNRAGRALTVARKKYTDARAALDARSVNPKAYKDAESARERLAEAQAANRREAEALHSERARLARVHATAAPLAALLRARAEQAALGPVAVLPADAAAQRETALAARTHATGELARAREREATLVAAHDAVAADPALLAEGGAIDALQGQLSRIVATLSDRDEQRGAAARADAQLLDVARQLGATGDVDDILARRPDALARAAAVRSMDAHAALATARQAAADELASARADAQETARSLDALPAPSPTDDLRDAIASVREEGRIDAACAEAAKLAADLARALTEALAALPLWSGDADALAAAPVPLESVVTAHASQARALATSLRDAQQDASRAQQALAAVAAELRGIEALGTVPNAAAIDATRARRDEAWDAIRADLAAGRVPGADALDALSALIAEADLMADRRASEAERVARHDQARAGHAQASLLRDSAQAALAAAEAAHAAALTDWTALWRPAGIEPDAPDAMREWLARRRDVLAARTAAQTAHATLDAAERRRATCRTRLRALLPDVPSGQEIEPLLRTAERTLRDREAATTRHADAVRARDEAARQVPKREAALAQAEAGLRRWAEEWAARAPALGIAPTATVEDGRVALRLWGEIDMHEKASREAHTRVARMTALLDRFDADVAGLRARIAPDLDGRDAVGAVRALAARLADARRDQAQRDEHARTLAALRADMEAAQDAADIAGDTLRALRDLAGVEDDAALAEAIARAQTHAALATQIAERQAELDRLGEGLSPEALTAEAGEVDRDAVPGRLTEIDERLRAIAEENTALAVRLADVTRELAAMEAGHDAAQAAQAMRDAAAEMEEIAARYVRVHMAKTLLNAAIERFREAQQAPLLAEAGRLFADLTSAGYVRLALDDAERGPTIQALRPDGTRCPHDRLSEGTRDQLYLALRLAAIGRDAEHAETLPFVADDLLVHFDDQRARAGLRVLADFGARTQTILFTHHSRIAEIAGDIGAAVHHLRSDGAPVSAG